MDARMCPRCKCKSVVNDIRSKVGLAMRSRTCPVCGRKWQTVEVERWHYDSLLTKTERRNKHGD